MSHKPVKTIVKRLFVLVSSLLFIASVAGVARAELRVVATTPDLAAVAKRVGGKHVKVKALALHSQDPHWVDPRPHLALELAKADLLLIVGMDLEVGWLPTLITGSRNASIQPGRTGHLNCSKFVRVLEVPRRVDRRKGDVHPQGNPHYMLDPRRAARVGLGIAKRMAKLDPKNAAVYRGNAKKWAGKLSRWQRHWNKKLAPLKGKPVISYHRSLVYLADWVKFRAIGEIEPRPGTPPSPKHVALMIRTAKDRKVRLLLQESWHSTSVSALVAKKSGMTLVRLPGLPNFRKGQSYIGFMNGLVGRIEKAFK